ncbi:MAG: hypothetical protein HZA49_00525 [Planctomycetes bacterium]|nr:hypothetical protein [Planctomycetota bacterium]
MLVKSPILTNSAETFVEFNTRLARLHRRRNTILLDYPNTISDAEKLSIYCQVLGVAVHGIKNPLCGIFNCLKLLAHTRRSPEQKKLLATIKQGLQIIHKTTAGLLLPCLFARTYKSDVNLNRLIQKALEFLKHSIKEKKAQVITQFAADLPIIKADKDKLIEVVFNLVINAMESVPQAGIITITTAHQPGQVILSVGDNGCGIPARELPYIFEPFISGRKLKRTGNSGLGLFIVSYIIALHHGTIGVKSRPRQGTTFTVSLPVK